MELRSSRSRSRTPGLLGSHMEAEVVKMGNNVEVVTTRSTRSTVKTYENYAESESVQSSKTIKMRPKKETVTRRKQITSDYSSEDGEFEVSSTKHIAQNSHNQFVEETGIKANGRETSALKIYKEAGQYWNKYPKTDYTYSSHSKDRIEIAPGVIAMPNMSRRSLLHTCGSSEHVKINKETSTDSFLSREANRATNYSENFTLTPKALFQNNNYDESEYVASQTGRTRREITVLTRIYTVITAIFTTMFSWTYYVNSGFIWVAGKIHKFVSQVMLWDTWLLQGHDKKTSSVLKLCLIPLIFFAGWWLLSGLGYAIYGSYFNSTETSILPLVQSGSEFVYEKDHQKSPRYENMINTETSSNVEEKIVKIREKIYLEPPSASEIASKLTTEQIQLIANVIKNSIGINEHVNEETIVETNPVIQNIVNNYNSLNVHYNELNKRYNELTEHYNTLNLQYNELKARQQQQGEDVEIISERQKHQENLHAQQENLHYGQENSDGNSFHDADMIKEQQVVINELKEEINKIHLNLLDIEKTRNEDLRKIISQFQADNAENNARINVQLSKCCRNSLIHMEDHVMRILTDILKVPSEYRSSKEDISQWLRGVFVARNELEERLLNLTKNLNSDFNSLLQNNGKLLMEEISGKVGLELGERFKKYEGRDIIDVDSVSDERIRYIVSEVLALYDADKTGLVDYAMEPSGGQVLSTRCTEGYQAGSAVMSMFGIPLWYTSNTPRTVITPGINPGECWAFQNFPGFLVIKLTAPVQIEAFSYEHVNRKLIPNGKIDSAPKEFHVFGLQSEDDQDPVLIGEYIYDYNGEPLQYFVGQHTGGTFKMIELRVISNHGNPNYTCLYRFRVHGKLGTEST